MNLGENIYRCRVNRNLSQGDLANELEVSRQSVSKWENNSAVPELDKLMELAQSISENGILQPLSVSMEEGVPVLVAGERRLRPSMRFCLCPICG